MKGKSLFLVVTLSLMMAACSNSKEEDTVEKLVSDETIQDVIENSTEETTILNPSDTSYLDQLNELFMLESSAVTVKLLSNVELDDSGRAMLDDSNEFAVVASVGDKNFVLMDQQTVQLGVPQVSMYENVNGKTVIVVSDIRTAKYDIFEYTYDESLGGFLVKCLTQNDGINFIGQTLI